MKSLRILFSIIALLMVVTIFMLGSLMFFVDPNKMKPMIADEVMKKTGYQLVMDGKLSWVYYPRIGVNVERMSLRTPNQPIPFVELQHVTIATSLMQLLQGNKKLDGDVYIANVNLMKLHMQDVRVGLHWQNKILTLEPIVASFYEGTLQGVAHGQDLSTMMRWDWDLEASHVQLKSLLNDINNPSSKIKLTGIGQIKLQAMTQGRTQEQILHNLNGIAGFSVNGGVIEGLDLNYYLQAADAYVNKQAIPEPPTLSQTVFDSLTGTANINHGIVHTNNLLLVSPEFATKGEGNIDLINETIDYRLQITPLHMTKLKWMVPVLVEGNLGGPSIRLDVLTLKTMMATEQLEKATAKLQEEAGKLPNKFEKLFQKVLNQ